MAQYSFERLRPEYEGLWGQMVVLKTQAATDQAKKVIVNKSRYLEVERRTSVPWFVVGCLHMRESNGDFKTYLGNGQPLNRVTTIVPKGRGPWGSFEDGAEDALEIDHLDQVKAWSAARVAYAMESFNGFGYRSPSRNIPSPYLWGGTNVQKSGKFVRDGVYNPKVMDPQIGGMAVLKQIMKLDSTAKFSASPQKPAAPPADETPTVSPKAEDNESQLKPLAKSKTMWGNTIQWLSGAGATVMAALAGVPWQVWVVIAVLIVIGAFLVYKGRIDVQKVVQHLSSDDTIDEAA